MNVFFVPTILCIADLNLDDMSSLPLQNLSDVLNLYLRFAAREPCLVCLFIPGRHRLSTIAKGNLSFVGSEFYFMLSDISLEPS